MKSAGTIGRDAGAFDIGKSPPRDTLRASAGQRLSGAGIFETGSRAGADRHTGGEHFAPVRYKIFPYFRIFYRGELAAVGGYAIIYCRPRLEWDIRVALESIKAGIEMGDGPAAVSNGFARRLLEYYGEKK